MLYCVEILHALNPTVDVAALAAESRQFLHQIHKIKMPNTIVEIKSTQKNLQYFCTYFSVFNSFSACCELAKVFVT